MENSVRATCPCCGDPGAGQPRRGFLAKSLGLVLGAAALATPVVVGIISFLNPLRQKGQAGELLRLAFLEGLPEGGPPVKFPVIMDRVDAWNRFPKQPVGAVFLRRVAKDVVQALQVVCPHAGCFVEYKAEYKKHKQVYKQVYVCPCHEAVFDLAGKRVEDRSESPRDLDELEVEVRGAEVWVKFQKFQSSTGEKIAQA